MLTGDAAKKYVADARAKVDRIRADRLAAAKADAAVRGKDSFDRGKLEGMCDASRERGDRRPVSTHTGPTVG
jgi:hypothetical protein